MIFIVDQLKLRLDRFLAEKQAVLSRSKIQKDIEAGKVKVNEQVISESKFVVRLNDQIDYQPDAERPAIAPRHLEIKTVFENDDLLIIDKPPGLVIHPAPGYKGITLAEGLLEKYKDIDLVGEEQIRPGIVHRLDKDTSGVMLVAKTQKMFEYLKDAFAGRKIRKEYLALLVGNLQSKHGFLNDPIGRHPTDFRKMATIRAKDVKEAITEYNVLGHYRGLELLGSLPASVDEFTFVRVKLHTGRTHQIRVHFSSLGFPLAGDSLYGNHRTNSLLPELHRQFLHAEKIEVKLPDGTWIEAQSQLPEDLQKVLDGLQPEL